MRLLAIDPGPEQSAWVQYIDGRPVQWAKEENYIVLRTLDHVPAEHLAVECVASYGMSVGADIFETCIVVGRLIERWLSDDPEMRQVRCRPEPIRVYRRDVKLHICGSPRAKDSNIRQALIDRYGPGKEKAVGLKANPGPLYGMSGDCWAALAVAITAAETRLDGREAA